MGRILKLCSYDIIFFLPVEMLFKFAKEFQGLWIIHYKMSTYKCDIIRKTFLRFLEF